MAYSRNFGFRSFENIVRRGRLRTPVGSALKIGAPVTLDAANPGRLKAAVAGAAAVGAGVVVFEHIQVKGVDAALAGTADFDTVPANAYAQVVSGPGVKVWVRNTAEKTLYDGRVIPVGSLLASSVNLGSLAIGAQLTPDGAGKFKVANGTTDGNWFTVESVNVSTATVELSFNF
jgi:hypothetical protein